MGYYVNPNELCSMFVVPTSVVDKHLKLATPTQLKILLWCLKNTDKGFNSDLVSETLNIDSSEVLDAFGFWCDRGMLNTTEEVAELKTEPENLPKVIQGNSVKPTREEATRRGLESPEIAFILQNAEQKLGRVLRANEITTLVWLYDDQGLSASLLLMIIGYAVSEGRANIGFIERTAVEWATDGVTDIVTAEERLVKMKSQQSAWYTVETAMGIERRKPSKSELEAADKWVNEWGYGREIFNEAYEICVDTTSKFSMPYIKKIIEKWHKAGVKTLDDIIKLDNEFKSSAVLNDDKKDKYTDFINNIILKDEEDK